MKQRYTVTRGPEADRILIHEEGELDKDLFSTQCSISILQEDFQQALSRGTIPAIKLIRSKDLFPAHPVAERIVQAIQAFLDDDANPVEINISDTDFIAHHTTAKRSESEDVDEDVDDLEDLLEEDDSEEFEDDFGLDDISPAIKPADNSGADSAVD